KVVEELGPRLLIAVAKEFNIVLCCGQFRFQLAGLLFRCFKTPRSILSPLSSGIPNVSSNM
ncbi:MAG: hypothetical protein IKC53_04780, partial [Lentisphaeria bacterium]|nr:hypothetical protein [Lentisphaeria bacterium]